MSGQSQEKIELPPGIFLAIGNPLLDMSATVDSELLRKYDVTPDSAVLAEERHLTIFQELADNFEVDYIAGGAAQNTVRVAQWMTGSTGATSYMGCIGNDTYGELIKQCALKDGVEVHYMQDESEATGTCAVLLSQGERSLIANLAAANNFSIDHLRTEKAESLLGRAKYIYFAGFFLTVSLESLVHVARRAVEDDKVFLFNLSAPFLIQYFQDRVATVLPYCDFLFGNETEAMTFGELKGWGDNLPQIALKLAALPKASGTRPRIVVITQGPRPTLLACQGKIVTFPVNPLANELLVDTNGAGDSFVGGFIAKLLQGEKLADCVRAGHFAARTVIQQNGCTFPKVCDFV